MGSDIEANGYPPSPVPSDHRLWPGELPFTAFGHLGEGRLDLRVFDQQMWWVDYRGAPHLIAEMSGEYIANVISFLEELREQYFVDSMRRAFIQTVGDQMFYGDAGGDSVAVELGGPTWSEISGAEWLESTPLMRELRRRSRGEAEGDQS